MSTTTTTTVQLTFMDDIKREVPVAFNGLPTILTDRYGEVYSITPDSSGESYVLFSHTTLKELDLDRVKVRRVFGFVDMEGVTPSPDDVVFKITESGKIWVCMSEEIEEDGNYFETRHGFKTVVDRTDPRIDFIARPVVAKIDGVQRIRLMRRNAARDDCYVVFDGSPGHAGEDVEASRVEIITVYADRRVV